MLRSKKHSRAAGNAIAPQALFASLVNAGPSVSYACKVNADCGMIADFKLGDVCADCGYLANNFVSRHDWKSRAAPFITSLMKV